MPYEIDWNHLPSSFGKSGNSDSGNGRSLNFIKFSDNSTHIIRPIGKAVGFWRFWYKTAKRYITANVQIDDSGKIIESNIDELKELLGCDPEQRFAINVIDRDDKQIKILQGPMTMLEQFAEVSQTTGNKPGGTKGGNWKITSKGSGKARRYNCNFLGPEPFTKEELARINNEDKTKNEWYVLDQVFKPTPMEDVNSLIGETEKPQESKSTTELDDESVKASVDEDLEF